MYKLYRVSNLALWLQQINKLLLTYGICQSPSINGCYSSDEPHLHFIVYILLYFLTTPLFFHLHLFTPSSTLVILQFRLFPNVIRGTILPFQFTSPYAYPSTSQEICRPTTVVEYSVNPLSQTRALLVSCNLMYGYFLSLKQLSSEWNQEFCLIITSVS